MKSPENGENVLKELYEDWIWEDLDYIKFINSENKVLQRIRENYQDQWEIVELCREALFENSKLITYLKERIEDVTTTTKKLS